MAAMMIPSAAPMMLAFARISRARAPTPALTQLPRSPTAK
jgi:predicted metal-binding membrane protein